MTAEIKTESKTTSTECPSCGKKAKRVEAATLMAMLKEDQAKQFLPNAPTCCASNGDLCQGIITDTNWRFCDSPDCDVVYISEEGGTTFTKSQLKVPVGVKETSGERPLCYCFGHSVASIKDELRTKGHSDALQDVRTKMKNPGCHCEASNPSGSCCLGSVTRGIEIARKELGMSDSDVRTTSAPHKPSGSKGEKIAKMGTVFSAILASACCWLPLLLLGVGVSGIGIVATLEAYRPLFIVVTFGFLGAAFYFTYRTKKATAEGGQDCCAPTGKGRLHVTTLNKVMLWSVTVLAVAFLFFPNYVGLLFGTGKDPAMNENVNQTVFKIDGMTCEGCATTVAQAIRQVPGVVAVEVNYQRRQAIVGTNPSQPVPKDRILAALKDAGYSGQIIDATDDASTSKSTSPKTKAADTSTSALLDLSPDAGELKAAFNSAKGNVRLLLIVSPG